MTRATRYILCVHILSYYTTWISKEMYIGNGSVTCRGGVGMPSLNISGQRCGQGIEEAV